MPYTADDFFSLRTSIVQNSILNPLLVGVITKEPEPIIVGKALVPLRGTYRRIVQKAKGPYCKLPSYIMADIKVQLYPECRIGYSYNDYPIFWEHFTSSTGLESIQKLKKIVRIINQKYKISNSKADSLFSSPPKSLVNLLKVNKISPNIWKNGFSKKFEPVATAPIDDAELEAYYKNLQVRLNDWRNFNKILISILKNHEFKSDKLSFGSLSVRRITSEGKMLYFYFKSFYEPSPQSTYVNCCDLTPTRWEIINPAIDIFTLRNMFST